MDYLTYIFSKESFDNINIWLKELKTYANPDAKVFLIGNKSDLESKREVKPSVAEEYKTDFGLNFFMECSAKSGINTQQIFIEAAKSLYTDYMKYNKSRSNSFSSGSIGRVNKHLSGNIQLNNKIDEGENETKKGCCE